MDLKKIRHEDLLKIINHIKNDKTGIDEYKDLNSYYKLMYKYLPSKNIVDFINNLINIPVCEYVDKIDKDISLLDSDGTLNSYWDEWHIRLTSQGRQDDIRFEKFRQKCFELWNIDKQAAEELYRITRTYIIENPIIESADEIKYIFINSKKLIPVLYRNLAIEYVRDCYDILKIKKEFKVCSCCGYVKNIDSDMVIHRLCNPKYEDNIFNRGTLIVKPEIFYSIINPGRFEYEVFNALLKSGFDATIFPEIEKDGDILVNIYGKQIYLDMKAYNYAENLYSELTNNKTLKDKYRNRWIVVPDLYYKEQMEFIGHLLRAGGSRLYNIEDLLNKLKRVAGEGKNLC